MKKVFLLLIIFILGSKKTFDALPISGRVELRKVKDTATPTIVEARLGKKFAKKSMTYPYLNI